MWSILGSRVKWTLASVCAGAVILAAGFALWRYRIELLGSTSQLGVVESAWVICISIAISVWSIRSLNDNAVKKALIVVFAGIGGVVSGVAELMTQIGQPGGWLYMVLIGGAFWLIGIFTWLFALAGVIRRKWQVHHSNTAA